MSNILAEPHAPGTASTQSHKAQEPPFKPSACQPQTTYGRWPPQTCVHFKAGISKNSRA